MKKDFGNYLGFAIMFGFGAIAFYRWYQSQLLFFLLLVLRDFVAAYFFLKRTEAKDKSGNFMAVVSYISSTIPLLYFGPEQFNSKLILYSNLLAIGGFLLVTLATIELGSSIGVSPARRILITSGVYKWLRHPMYVGYGISELGMALINPLNVGVFTFSASLYFVRASSEKRILGLNKCKT